MKNKFLLPFFLFFLILCGCMKQEQEKDIYILYTNDVASHLDSEVGYAGVKGYRDQLISQGYSVGLVDAGDFFDGEVSSSTKGKAIVEIMNAVSYDAVALGNQEFSIGLDALAENITESSFDYLSCNLRYSGFKEDPLKEVKPYVIRKYDHVKIAFVGVTTPDTLVKNKPAHDAIVENGELIYDLYVGNEGQDLYEQVQKNVDEARKTADYVIVLSHLGSNSVREHFSSYDLIANTNGIDAVIDGHSHTVISGEAVDNKDGDMVVLTSTGEKMQNLGVMVIHPDHTFSTVLYPSIAEKDPEIEALVASVLR